MRELLGEEELNLEQATVIARAMWKVAEAEHGVHQKEREMIDAFYLSCAQDAQAAPQDIHAVAFNADEARRVLSTASQRETLLRSCYLLGYADGLCSPAERSTIDAIARDLEISDDRRRSVDLEIKKMLLSQFDDIKVFKNVTYEIGKQLGMSVEEVDEVLAHQG